MVAAAPASSAEARRYGNRELVTPVSWLRGGRLAVGGGGTSCGD